MRACWFAVVAATFFCTSARAEFVLQFDPGAKILADAQNQVVDLYLTSTTTVQISRIFLRTYLGDERSDVRPESGLYPASHLGTKGNFEKGGLYTGGVEVNKEFWGDNATAVLHFRAADYGQNVAQVQINGGGFMPPLQGNQPVKVATFHIDTTGFFGPKLNIGLDHDDYFTDYNGFFTRVGIADASGRPGPEYWIGSNLAVLGGEYSISSTPEPSVIGLAGLSLVAGAGWVRSRRRRRRAFPTPASS